MKLRFCAVFLALFVLICETFGFENWNRKSNFNGDSRNSRTKSTICVNGRCKSDSFWGDGWSSDSIFDRNGFSSYSTSNRGSRVSTGVRSGNLGTGNSDSWSFGSVENRPNFRRGGQSGGGNFGNSGSRKFGITENRPSFGHGGESGNRGFGDGESWSFGSIENRPNSGRGGENLQSRLSAWSSGPDNFASSFGDSWTDRGNGRGSFSGSSSSATVRGLGNSRSSSSFRSNPGRGLFEEKFGDRW